MSYKTILAVIQGSADLDRVLDCAIPLAERLGGHLIAAHAEPMPIAYATTVGYADTVLIESQIAANRDRSKALEARFEARAAKAGIQKDWRSIENYTGDSALSALNSARSADLIVAAQAADDDPAAASGELDTLLFEAGRPVLLVPRDVPLLTRFPRVTVAWNGTRESSRATFDAMPFILESDQTEILLVDPPEDSDTPQESDGRDIVATLERHGVNVTLASKRSEGQSVGTVIETHVIESASDLLVMGAYSHSRLREWLFGGVTRTMMKAMPVATLMSR